MYCRNCSNEFSKSAIACSKCGIPPFKGKHFCNNCGASTHEDAIICVSCGVNFKNHSSLPSLESIQSIKTEEIVQEWANKYSYSTYAIIFLLSFLPFINIKCMGNKVFSVTGLDMAIGKEINNLNEQTVNLFRWDIFGFYILIGIALYFIFNNKFNNARTFTRLSIAPLCYFVADIYLKMESKELGGVELSYGLGFWLTAGFDILTIFLLEKYIELTNKVTKPILPESNGIEFPPPLFQSNTENPPPLLDTQIEDTFHLDSKIEKLVDSKGTDDKGVFFTEAKIFEIPPPLPLFDESKDPQIEENQAGISIGYQQILFEEKKTRLKNRMILLLTLLLILGSGIAVWYSYKGKDISKFDVSGKKEISTEINKQAGVIFTNLSKIYNFHITEEKVLDEDNHSKIKSVTIDVIGKSDLQILQTIIIDGISFNNIYSSFQDQGSVRSYITGVNEHIEVLDGDYGNFLVQDFNFDGKEDFAIKYNCGQGQMGCFYKFYTFRNDGKFKEDIFLTELIQNPPKIYFENKSISKMEIDWDIPNTSEANPQGYITNFYSYNNITEKWTKINTIRESIHTESDIFSNNPILNQNSKYIVTSNKAFFYNSPDKGSIRDAYLVKNELMRACCEINGFVWTKFENKNGKTSEGFINKKDVSLYGRNNRFYLPEENIKIFEIDDAFPNIEIDQRFGVDRMGYLFYSKKSFQDLVKLFKEFGYYGSVDTDTTFTGKGKVDECYTIEMTDLGIWREVLYGHQCD